MEPIIDIPGVRQITLPTAESHFAEHVAAFFGARVETRGDRYEVRLGETVLCAVYEDGRVRIPPGTTAASLMDVVVSAFAPRYIESTSPREIAETICRAGLTPAWLVLAVGPDAEPDEWAGHGERVIVVQRAEVVSGVLPSTRVPGGSLGVTIVAEHAERIRIGAGVDRLEIWATGTRYWTGDRPCHAGDLHVAAA